MFSWNDRNDPGYGLRSSVILLRFWSSLVHSFFLLVLGLRHDSCVKDVRAFETMQSRYLLGHLIGLGLDVS